MTQPVRTSAWVPLWQRSRNGPSGFCSKVKQPTSSIGAVTAWPDGVWISAVPRSGGTSWPNRAPSAISTSMEKLADWKVRARTDAASDRSAAACPASRRES